MQQLSPSPQPPSQPQTQNSSLALDAVSTLANTTPFAHLGQEWIQAERAWNQERSRRVLAGEAEVKRITAAMDQADPEEDVATVEASLKHQRERWLALVVRAGNNTRKQIQNAWEQRSTQTNAGTIEIPLGDQRAELEAELAERQRRFAVDVQDLGQRIERLQSDIAKILRQTGAQMVAPASAAVAFPNGDLASRLHLVGDHLSSTESALAGIRASTPYAMCRSLGVVRSHILIGVPFLLALGLFIWLEFPDRWLYWAAASGAVSQLLVLAWTTVFRWQLSRRFARVNLTLHPLPERFAELQNAGQRELDPATWIKQQIERNAAMDRANRAKEEKAQYDQTLADTRRREHHLRDRVVARFKRSSADVQREVVNRRAARQARLTSEREQRQQAAQVELEAMDQRWAVQRTHLDARWRRALDDLRQTAGAALAVCTSRHPAWQDTIWSTWNPPAVYGSDILIGTVVKPLAELAAVSGVKALTAPAGEELSLPVTLTFPAQATLLVRTGPQGRDMALTLVNQALLRALTSFPGGGVRLTLIDPVGLGNSFADLLDLKDHDDALIGGGVLVEPEKIEQGLQDLCSHLEKVIQKHLRGRYANLDEYNREAGEMREAVRLVVVADFPSGFGERALERLDVIARSGARCGVHLILMHDERRPLPPPLDLAWFKRNAVMLRQRDGDMGIEHAQLEGWRFRPAPVPASDLQARLLAQIGKESNASRRIEVRFTAIAPTADRLWSLSAAQHLRVPIGKRGAEGLQYFDLGRGTAQHALIGGRTGSGKSTLFHVLITSASLWYGPKELEFHLIDFKKGVEFKAFATHRLPHARIIAIESDREFGLSVLRHLDQELTRRGDAFRQVGAQDLAAHRAHSGEHLPRILLLIDEFQEFFTEDDAIARDAALLLDRFVRQGRAFGLHVVLGSQTLGGSYSLAKSSIGQMGVRVALPCNEADAHLLLHEDNDAARLLSRPGDGIYNDRAGLVEGNSPFQVCWLSDDEEAQHLNQIAKRATSESWRPARPPVYFEGNGPSRIEDELELAALLARPVAPKDARMRAAIGQSSSLKGPAEVNFSAAAGGNLIIIGQNREAATATCGALAIGLSARYAPGALRLLSIDGEDSDGVFAAFHARLATALPHHPVRHEARDLPAVLTELSAVLEKRQNDGSSDRSPVLLTIFALQRLRQLRSDDDAGFSRDGEPPVERFTKLLANGPEYGIHVVVWCDSLASVQRGLGRRALRDFDARILFQMSAADSSELIDDDGASRLGLHTALLSVLTEGRREKFRPFSQPDGAFLAQVTAALATRFPG